MIKIISFTICPFVQRVTALLEAKNISYDIEFISLSDKPDWFLEISPAGQVPVLVTKNGETLFESDAIVEYIDEITPALISDIDPVQRAKDRAWSYQAAKHYLVQCSTMRSGNKKTFDERFEKLSKSFDRIEKRLNDTPYFTGNEIGNVDIAWLPLLHRALIVKEESGFDMFKNHPKIARWQHALSKTGLYEKSVADEFYENFVGFYLNDKTFLGRGANDNEEICAAQNQSKGCC